MLRICNYLGIILFLSLISSQAFAQGTWTKKTDFPDSSRIGCVAFSIGSKGYLGTGQNSTDSGLFLMNDFWEYDPQVNSWSQRADFAGVPRTLATGFSIGNKGYIGTGMDSSNFTFYSVLNDFWEYDPTLNVWTKKADFAGNSRRSASGFSIGSMGYIGTGEAMTGSFQDVWSFDPILDVWTQKADFGGGPRNSAVGFSIENNGYIGTGSNTSDVWQYDPIGDSWALVVPASMFGRSYAISFTIGGKGYVGLGDLDKEIWEFDPASNTWDIITQFPGIGRNGAVAFSIDNCAYIVSGEGLGGAYTSELWQYCPDEIAGLNERQLSEFLIHPSPTTGLVNIVFQDKLESLEVYNVLGSRMRLKQVNENCLDLSKVSDGVYFIRIETKEGVVTRKVIKQSD